MYIQPEIEIQIVKTESLLSSSGGDGVASDFIQEEITDQTQILSKEHKFDVWDEE